jgi:thiamine pyrophosphokinase
LRALDRPPDVVVGDMDSLPEGIRPWLEARLGTADTEFVEYPPAKDETDLELALLLAATRFDDEIWLFGALGGRLDQTLANILLLASPTLEKRRIVMITEWEKAWLLTGKTEIHGTPGDMVSLIPLGGDVFMRATTGLQWPLIDERLTFGLARGVSNVMMADVATVVIRNGRLLCIHSTKRETTEG